MDIENRVWNEFIRAVVPKLGAAEYFKSSSERTVL
jgi:hypothetical protein